MEQGEPGASGCLSPAPIERSETTIEIEMPIYAINQEPEIDFLEKERKKEDHYHALENL